MIHVGKYKNLKVVFKQTSDGYDIYPIEGVSQELPLSVKANDRNVTLINPNRLSPKELREMVKLLSEELATVYDAWDTQVDELEAGIEKHLGQTGLEVLDRINTNR